MERKEKGLFKRKLASAGSYAVLLLFLQQHYWQLLNPHTLNSGSTLKSTTTLAFIIKRRETNQRSRELLDARLNGLLIMHHELHPSNVKAILQDYVTIAEILFALHGLRLKRSSSIGTIVLTRSRHFKEEVSVSFNLFFYYFWKKLCLFKGTPENLQIPGRDTLDSESAVWIPF